MKHDVGDIYTGNELIMTLADSNVLIKDDLDRTLALNESEDLLENVAIRENENRIVAGEKKRRAFRGVYNSYDDEEFAVDAFVGKKRNLLSHYDDENWTGKVVQEKPKFRIGESGASTCTTENLNDEKIMLSNEESQCSNLNAKYIAGDYFTTSDYVNFKADRTRGKNIRRTRSKKSYEVSEDHKADSSDVLVRRKNTKNLLDSTFGTKLSTVDDVDVDLTHSLIRARRVAQLRSEIQSMEHGAEVASLISATQVQRSDDTSQVELDVLEGGLENTVDANGRRPDGTLLFSSATEFTARLLSRLNENVEDRVVNAANESERMERKKHFSSNTYSSNCSIDEDEVEIEAVQSISNPRGDRRIEYHVDLVHKVPIRGDGGMAAILTQLRGSNEFKYEEELMGRTNDERIITPSNGVGTRDSFQDINLDYHDGKGRKLAPKEAYRQLCYNFHGYGPGKSKSEKRKDKEEEIMRTQSNLLCETGMKKSLLKAQEATGKAHFIMDSYKAGYLSGSAAFVHSATDRKVRK